MIWGEQKPFTQETDRETRIAFLILCNLYAAAALFVAFFPGIAEKIWR